MYMFFNLNNLKNYFVKNFILHLYFLLNINILCYSMFSKLLMEIKILRKFIFAHIIFPNLFYYRKI